MSRKRRITVITTASPQVEIKHPVNVNAIISKNPRTKWWEVAIVTPQHTTKAFDSFRSLRTAIEAAEGEQAEIVYLRHHWTLRGPKWANSWRRVGGISPL